MLVSRFPSKAAPRRTLALLAAAWLTSTAGFAAAPATGLAPGKAKGTLTVNGKAVTLAHAYAALEPNPFDAKKNDIVVLLTAQPLDAAAVAGTLSDATRGITSYLRLTLRDSPDMAKNFGFLGNWIIGNRMLRHEMFKDKALQSSPDFDSKVDAVVVGADRVEATVYTAAPAKSFDGTTFEYRVSFNTTVKARPK